VVMHDGSLEFRLEEVSVRAGSRLAGRTLREANVGETTGALVLALRGHDGTFLANPPMQTSVSAGHVLIAIGTQQQLAALQHAADRVGLRPGTIPAPSARAASRRHATPDPANVIRAQTPAPDDSPCGGQYLDHRCGGECLVAQHSDTTFISPLTVSAALPRAPDALRHAAAALAASSQRQVRSRGQSGNNVVLGGWLAARHLNIPRAGNRRPAGSVQDWSRPPARGS